jgi:broad specificity phosphatase PhoE
MTLIVVVRHAQASFFSADYDQLSELGREQARLLGEHWAAQGLLWDRVVVGPRKRHRETEEVLASVYRERGLDWPGTESLATLDEIDMSKVLAHMDGVELRPGVQTFNVHEVPEDERAVVTARALKRVLAVMRDFAAGRIDAPGAESWHEFRERAARALDELGANERHHRVLGISSGGLISMLVGCALGLSDEKVIDIAVNVRNTSYTTFAKDRETLTLAGFNSAAHLPPLMWTIG